MFKRKTKTPNAPAPRAMDEIQKEYQSVSAQASNAQYQAFVFARTLRRLNQRMLELNEEAAGRQALDKQVADELAKQKDPSNG